jgi:hypothetical protein
MVSKLEISPKTPQEKGSFSSLFQNNVAPSAKVVAERMEKKSPPKENQAESSSEPKQETP